MSKRNEKVSMFGIQNLLLLSDFLDDQNTLYERKEKEKKIEKTFDNLEKRRLKTASLHVVLVGNMEKN